MKQIENANRRELSPRPNPAPARFQQAITEIALLIRDSPDTSGGVQLRRFLWSLYNMHHLVNLWDLASRVGGELAEPVSAIIRAALAGELREDDVKRGLVLAGEMERWDAAAPSGDVFECVEDAVRSAVVADGARAAAGRSEAHPRSRSAACDWGPVGGRRFMHIHNRRTA